MNDNAGITLSIVDKSQVPASAAPNALYAAGFIVSERGFVDQVYTLSNGTYDREMYFGKKDNVKYGTSAHDIDKFLASKCPAYVVRAGKNADAESISAWVTNTHYSASTIPPSKVVHEGEYLYCTSSHTSGTFAVDASKWWYYGYRLAGATMSVGSPTGIKMGPFSFIGKTQGQATSFAGDDFACIVAKGEGTWGNTITVTFDTYDTDQYKSDDHLVISKVTIAYQGIQVEQFPISPINTDTDEKGVSIYFVNQFNSSKYVSIFVKEGYQGTSQIINASGAPVVLFGGQGDDTNTPLVSSDYQRALKKVIDYPDTYDAFISMNCAGLIEYSSFYPDVVTNGRTFGLSCAIKADALNTNLMASEWATTKRAGEYAGTSWLTTLFNQWVLTNESESGQDIYISPVGYAAYVIGAQAQNNQLPYAPAGYRRGTLVGAKGLSRSWSGAERVTLTSAQWNPIKQSARGIVFWDELTTQTTKSAFSNSHVALSALAQMRGIEKTLVGTEFEFNDQDTIDSILIRLKPLADQYVAGKYAEQIIVDAKNNVIGSDQIKLRWNIRFKGVARTVDVSIIAYPSTQDLSVSISQ